MVRKTGKEIRSKWEVEREKEKSKYGGFEKYEVEEWSRTLQSAAEIMTDPKKMAAVSKCLKMKADSIETLKKFTAEK